MTSDDVCLFVCLSVFLSVCPSVVCLFFLCTVLLLSNIISEPMLKFGCSSVSLSISVVLVVLCVPW